MNTGSLNIPAPKPISRTSEPLNYSFVGDEAFGLSENMLRPYSGKHLDFGKRIFNYRLSRARRCTECTFGLLTNRWRILHRPLNVSIEFAEDIVKACCILHNFVRQRDGFNFHDTLNITGPENIENIHMPVLRKITTRDKLKHFFLSKEGALSWQENRI
ncbi:hypothetical protein NQ314_014098 [Rhamnusium bicolor]|uniref:DDE Tnp4 domain-containing protein n=1 Tax=Rhamnusium bicolor TaxID=1586634 RepID=A0AAV8X3E0_9CUCU|nr:hypothetical protein NQ314_014098 [Rhamnusium bicolor]